MNNQMKALVKAKAESGLWMEHVPIPEPDPDEVLIKVKKSAICGTIDKSKYFLMVCSVYA